MSIIKRIKIFTKDDEKAKANELLIKQKFINSGFEIAENNIFDLGFAIGGDGTFLKMIRDTQARQDVIYAGVNCGTLGFLLNLDIKELDIFIDLLKFGKVNEYELNMIDFCVKMKDKEVKYFALNEIVIRDSLLNCVAGDVIVDGDLLEQFYGDGLLVCSSTGSTAYNLSLNGAILYHTIKAMEITPIASINSKAYRTLSSPIVLPEDKTIEVKLKDKSIILLVDGVIHHFDNVKMISINLRKKGIRCVKFGQYKFIKTVYDKFCE